MPKENFVETYARHAKLVVMGTAHVPNEPQNDADATFEISLTETSPLTDGLLRVSGVLLRDARPLANQQVTVFSAVGNNVHVSRLISGTDGTFVLSVSPDARVLFNSVVLSEVAEEGVVWHSDWASMLLVPPQVMD